MPHQTFVRQGRQGGTCPQSPRLSRGHTRHAWPRLPAGRGVCPGRGDTEAPRLTPTYTVGVPGRLEETRQADEAQCHGGPCSPVHRSADAPWDPQSWDWVGKGPLMI